MNKHAWNVAEVEYIWVKQYGELWLREIFALGQNNRLNLNDWYSRQVEMACFRRFTKIFATRLKDRLPNITSSFI